jgi:hypothetical protein
MRESIDDLRDTLGLVSEWAFWHLASSTHFDGSAHRLDLLPPVTEAGFELIWFGIWRWCWHWLRAALCGRNAVRVYLRDHHPFREAM